MDYCAGNDEERSSTASTTSAPAWHSCAVHKSLLLGAIYPNGKLEMTGEIGGYPKVSNSQIRSCAVAGEHVFVGKTIRKFRARTFKHLWAGEIRGF